MRCHIATTSIPLTFPLPAPFFTLPHPAPPFLALPCCALSSEYLPSGASSGEGDDDADLVSESDDDHHRGAGARRQRSRNDSGNRRRRRGGGSGGQASDSEVSVDGSDGSGGASEDEGGEYDDADAEYYEQRLERAVGSGFLWQAWGVDAAAGASGGGGSAAAADAQQEEQEGRQRDEEDVVFDGGFRVPGRVYSRLFPYQQTAVKWLWELYTQKAGGILGDEVRDELGWVGC